MARRRYRWRRARAPMSCASPWTSRLDSGRPPPPWSSSTWPTPPTSATRSASQSINRGRCTHCQSGGRSSSTASRIQPTFGSRSTSGAHSTARTSTTNSADAGSRRWSSAASPRTSASSRPPDRVGSAATPLSSPRMRRRVPRPRCTRSPSRRFCREFRASRRPRTSMSAADEWVWGWDSTPGIVSVHASLSGRALVWRRDAAADTLVLEEERFRPWVLLAHLDDAVGLEYRELAGPGALRYLVSADDGRHLIDAVLRAASKRLGTPLSKPSELTDVEPGTMLALPADEQYLVAT